MRLLVALCLACITFTAQAGEAAYTVRATEMRAKPFSDAAAVASLPENSPVEVLTRKAGWMQIKGGDKNGWVKLLDLRFGDASAPKKSGSSGLGALFNVATGGGNTVSTGVRGLSEEKLKDPKPDPQALETVQHYAVSKNDAMQFGRAGQLAAQSIDYLPVPTK